MRGPREMLRTVRGVEVIIFADEFDGDPSVGIGYWPESIWAETMNKEPFELTDEEQEQFGIEAATAYNEQSDHDWD